ncbi:enoyl-CoA hydratase/isomerase family protein [Streptomyces lushanensis]|uniref:enoyl-CoA hydratase/isomerase family protein n=1 Tax=Streptomyces lushanensis TaxID=1434255 RepID=UPI00082E2FFF|nr:enoyl-CoA hydratase/isomerase family protein [Streptomyces lushanensis]
MEPQLLHTVSDGIATVVIHHPAKRNAMTASMWRELPPLLGRLAVDPAVRALVLTGEGGTFCAGADISSLREPAQSRETRGEVPGEPRDEARREVPPEAGGDPRPDDPRSLAVRAEETLAAFPKPTLAAVRGHCVGGGCQLAAACDLRFAEEGALFGVTPARLGIVYPASSTRRLVSLVGPSTAKYLLFSAELIGTERALRTGLVDEVLPAGGLDRRVAEFGRVLVSRSRLTQAAAKESASGGPDRTAYWTEQARSSGETEEGVAAFLERREPRFGWTVGA